MEKLQAALTKARAQRSGPPAAGSAQAEQRPLRSTPGLVGIDALWDRLTPFEVPRAVLEKHRLVTRDVGTASAPFDILRTKLLVQMRKHGWKRIAITSPMPQSGKTTIASNLALGLGRQGELRSILMDMDLRAPSVHSYFETMPEYGIGDLLTGKVDFETQALRMGNNVAISMARHAEADPTQLLLAPDTIDVLDEIEERYQPDLMIFDLPSVLVNDETRAFLKNVDCALIVIRASMTRYKQFDNCEKEIVEQTNIIGTVLNAYMSGDTHNN